MFLGRFTCDARPTQQRSHAQGSRVIRHQVEYVAFLRAARRWRTINEAVEADVEAVTLTTHRLLTIPARVMTDFYARETLPYSIPDDLTLAQFTLDAHHPARAIHPQGVPWLVQDETGRKVDLEEVRLGGVGSFVLHEALLI